MTDSNPPEVAPRCEICGQFQPIEGEDWNGETGNHKTCEEGAPPPEIREIMAVLSKALGKRVVAFDASTGRMAELTTGQYVKPIESLDDEQPKAEATPDESPEGHIGGRAAQGLMRHLMGVAMDQTSDVNDEANLPEGLTIHETMASAWMAGLEVGVHFAVCGGVREELAQLVALVLSVEAREEGTDIDEAIAATKRVSHEVIASIMQHLEQYKPEILANMLAKAPAKERMDA